MVQGIFGLAGSFLGEEDQKARASLRTIVDEWRSTRQASESSKIPVGASGFSFDRVLLGVWSVGCGGVGAGLCLF